MSRRAPSVWSAICSAFTEAATLSFCVCASTSASVTELPLATEPCATTCASRDRFAMPRLIPDSAGCAAVDPEPMLEMPLIYRLTLTEHGGDGPVAGARIVLQRTGVRK